MKFTIRQSSYRVGPDFSTLKDCVAWMIANVYPNQTVDARVYRGRKWKFTAHADKPVPAEWRTL